MHIKISFKPYYKWITFNTYDLVWDISITVDVLNLIINGLPSILPAAVTLICVDCHPGFKPYYKWITFNTMEKEMMETRKNIKEF